VGARAADLDHAARPLAGDARDRPGPRRPGGARRAAARRGGTGHRRRFTETVRIDDLRSVMWCWSVPAPGPRRRDDRRRCGGRGRVDDHRRVQPRVRVRQGTGWSRPRWSRMRACGSRSPRPATTRRWRGSSGWSPTRSPRGRDPGAGRPGGGAAVLRRGRGRDADRAGVEPARRARVRGRPDVTVLVIACPHALGLAIPLVTSISTSKSARSGILVKDRLALEQMRRSTRCCSTRPAP
jgi:hypothetical protein